MEVTQEVLVYPPREVTEEVLVDPPVPEPVCGICGEPHKYSECSLLEIKNHIKDDVIPSKARLTLPKGIGVETMADGTYCVVAKTCIERGTQFGPLEARKLLTLNPNTVFPLKLFNNDVEDLCEYYLDTCDEDYCNWLIFITPAQDREEQNLICFQGKSKIYYVTIKDIQVGEVMKVWYSPYYATKMKKNVLTSQNFTESDNLSNEILQPLDLNSLVKKQQKTMERDNWTCKFCGKLESDIAQFASHIIKHYTNRLKRHCDICSQSFSNLKSLRRHIRSEHKKNISNTIKVNEEEDDKAKVLDAVVGGPLLNDLLNDSLDNTNLILPSIELNQLGITSTNSIENENMLLEGDGLSLNVDNLLTENVKELDHFNFEIGESQEQFVCDVCLKVFAKLTYLLQHLKKHTGMFTCRHCLKIFCRYETLNAHKCINEATPQHICTLCQRGFMLKKYLFRHMKAIHDQKHTCENCNKKYYSHKEYKEHNCSAVPDIYKQTYSCATCNKTFLREVYLRKHLKTHMHRERQNKVLSKCLICEVCAQRFSTRKGLQMHMKLHLECTVTCQICNRKFYRQDVLERHLMTHGDAKVTCTVCNTKLKSKRTLATHMWLHKGVKRHKCDICSQEFHQRSALAKHFSKVHLKLCRLCGKGFATDELLERHISEHPLREVFVCPLCSKVLKIKHSLRRHLKKVHPQTDGAKIMADIKPIQIEDAQKCAAQSIFNNNAAEVKMGTTAEPYCVTNSIHINANVDANVDANNDSFENLVDNIIGSYGSSDTTNLVLGNYGNPVENSSEKTTVDFNDLEIDLDTAFNVEPSLTVNNHEVCLSMPDLTELDQEITLGENAYILENGTIVEPNDKGNVLVYILDKQL